MKVVVSIQAELSCSLERAFKTPLLCDVTKIHSGYLFMPKVTRCTGDDDWGKVGSTKKVFAAKSLTQNGGFLMVERLLERVENRYWKFELIDFQSWSLGLKTFIGEWEATEISPNRIKINYTYTLHSDQAILFPIQWLFGQTFWRLYMYHVLGIIRKLVSQQEPYQHD